MQFPADHYPHYTALEWWYFWGLFGESYFHHSLFKTTLGNEQRLYLHSSLNGEFGEADEDEIEGYEYYTVYSRGRFIIKNSFLSLSLFPTSQPLIHSNSVRGKYYSLPSLVGTTPSGQRVEAWFDHEYFNLPDRLTKGMVGKLSWDWTSIKYNNGSYMVRANGKYNIKKGELIGDVEEVAKEVIFKPKYGIPYSETPLVVSQEGSIIGHGMRERTYPLLSL
jgi:hypothetical protein